MSTTGKYTRTLVRGDSKFTHFDDSNHVVDASDRIYHYFFNRELLSYDLSFSVE